MLIDCPGHRRDEYRTMSFKPTIFIVDDDEPVRESLKALMHSNGLAAEVYGSGEEFLNAHDASRHGCVLLDIEMSGMTGFEVLDSLKSNGVDTPVILITGGAHPEDQKVRQAGAIALLGKPLCSQALFDAIGRALEHSRTNSREDNE